MSNCQSVWSWAEEEDWRKQCNWSYEFKMKFAERIQGMDAQPQFVSPGLHNETKYLFEFLIIVHLEAMTRCEHWCVSTHSTAFEHSHTKCSLKCNMPYANDNGRLSKTRVVEEMFSFVPLYLANVMESCSVCYFNNWWVIKELLVWTSFVLFVAYFGKKETRDDFTPRRDKAHDVYALPAPIS